MHDGIRGKDVLVTGMGGAEWPRRPAAARRCGAWWCATKRRARLLQERAVRLRQLGVRVELGNITIIRRTSISRVLSPVSRREPMCARSAYPKDPAAQ